MTWGSTGVHFIMNDRTGKKEKTVSIAYNAERSSGVVLKVLDNKKCQWVALCSANPSSLFFLEIVHLFRNRWSTWAKSVFS